MKKYLISANSEHVENEAILKKHFSNGVSHFSTYSHSGRDWIDFEIKLDSDEDFYVRDLALIFQKIYEIPTIQIWKKSLSKDQYDIALSYFYESDQIELLLGSWEDWDFNKGNSELQSKDKALKKLYED